MLAPGTREKCDARVRLDQLSVYARANETESESNKMLPIQTM